MVSLSKILSSRHFSNSSVLRKFLIYVVEETLSGRSDRIKSYTVGIEVLGRGSDFDASGDAIVRNTARRLRTALAAYYETEGAGDAVVVRLPKGRYVPVFEWSGKPTGRSGPATGRTGAQPPRLLRRVRSYVAVLLVGAAAAMAVFAFAMAPRPGNTISTIAIAVERTRALDERYRPIAAWIDARLAPQMARLDTATIVTGLEIVGSLNSPSGAIVLSLQSAIGAADSDDPLLLWRLIDGNTGVLLWASSEPLSGDLPSADIDTTVQRLAFKLLGENGVLQRSLSRIDGATSTRTACLASAQTLARIYAESENGELRRCLEELTTRHPLDATAWAVLSAYYTIKGEALGLDGRDTAELQQAAERALHKAIDLTPNAYATQVAQMYLSFNRDRIADFDAIAERLLATYPGDAYLQVRIANRYIRLGRSDAGAALLVQAIEELNIIAGHEFYGMALAAYQAGRYSDAQAFLDKAGPTATALPMLLRAAILGHLGRGEAARRAVEAAYEAAPHLMADFPGILNGRKWPDDVIESISEGVQKARMALAGTQHPAELADARND